MQLPTEGANENWTMQSVAVDTWRGRRLMMDAPPTMVFHRADEESEVVSTDGTDLPETTAKSEKFANNSTSHSSDYSFSDAWNKYVYSKNTRGCWAGRKEIEKLKDSLSTLNTYITSRRAMDSDASHNITNYSVPDEAGERGESIIGSVPSDVEENNDTDSAETATDALTSLNGDKFFSELASSR
ncbi:Hypothetical predicted protein [Cloeon dipterum]|uniref:Uncharacterized protein n=1 Tax=Cloeon dipterum TaxID=197152 RepID=A0A8S1BP69_9INSE|nr:Hypothetical predicted protein [Cloeon dipterum]